MKQLLVLSILLLTITLPNVQPIGPSPSKTNSDSFSSLSFDPNTFFTSGQGRSLSPDYSGRVLVLSRNTAPLGREIVPPLSLGERYLHFVEVNGLRELKELAYSDQVEYLTLDAKVDFQGGNSQSNSSYFQDISYTQKVNAELNITGSGVVIGVTDTGVDFGNSDLQSSVLLLPSGISASFDATGFGIAIAPLEVRPQTLQGITFLPLENQSFNVWGGEQGRIYNSSNLGIQLKNLDISSISRPSVSGRYKVGIALVPFQGEKQLINLFIFVLTDSVDPGVYDTLYVDMDTSLGLSLALNNIIFESGALYQKLVRWSLNDEVPYGAGNPVVARDIDGDGVNDVSLGTIGTTLDIYGLIDQGLVRGIQGLGEGFAFVYDAVGHGTQSASAAAGRGIVNYPIYDDVETEKVENATHYKIPGSAPGAKLLATKGYTLSDFLIGWLWEAGLEPTSTGWIVNKDHLVDISTNSWGNGSISSRVKGADLYSLFLDALSQPDIFSSIGSIFDVTYTDYPGIAFVVSIGNGGPGFGTLATPGAAALAFTVGAATSFLNYQMNQSGDIALFSSEGPAPFGYVKPDAVALGSFGFTSKVVALGLGNGTYASGSFGGTSEAGPRAAGMMALVYEALRKQGIEPDLGKARTILKSTAQDLGFSPVAQGAGLLDAWKAVNSALGGPQIIVRDYTGPALIGQRLTNAFEQLFGTPHPATLNLFPDSMITVDKNSLQQGYDIELTYGNGTVISSSPSFSFTRLREVQNYASSFTSLSDPNATASIPLTLDVQTTLMELTVSLDNASYRQLEGRGYLPPTIKVVNPTTGVIVAEVYSTAYATTIYSGYPRSDFGSEIGFSFKDPGYADNVFGWKSLQYSVNVKGYQRLTWNSWSVQPSSNGFRLSSTETHFEIGTLQISLNGSTSAYIPVTYSSIQDVKFGDSAGFIGNLDDNNDLYELDESAPSWNWLGQTARPEAGDHRFYYVSVPSNATFLAFSVQWDRNPFLPNLYLYSANGSMVAKSDVTYEGSGLYSGTTSEKFRQNIIVPTSGGEYILEMHVTQTPFDSKPIEVRVLARYLTVPSLPEPVVSFSQNIADPVTGILGINANNYSVDSFPEFSLQKTDVMVYQFSNDTLTGTIASADLQKGENSPEVQLSYDFQKGQKVTLRLNWTLPSGKSADLDIKVMSFASDLQPKDDVLAGLGTTPGPDEEVASFGVEETAPYIIYIDFIDGPLGEDISWTLTIESRQGPIFNSDSSELLLDTSLFADGNYGLELSWYSNFGVVFVQYYSVNFENHSPFTVDVLSPTSGETISGVYTVEWNAPSGIKTTVELVSNDVTYSLATGITESSFSFDTSQFPNGDVILVLTFTDGFSIVTKKIPVTIKNDNPSSLPPYQTSSSTRPISYPAVIALPLMLLLVNRRRKRREISQI